MDVLTAVFVQTAQSAADARFSEFPQDRLI